MRRTILYSEQEIAERVRAMAHEIATGPVVPHLAVPILVGAYVFAADLLRALALEGISLPTEFLWLRSYTGRSSGKGVNVLIGPNENFRGKNILIVDGVLDGGHTIKKARDLVLDYGAAAVVTAVIVDKMRPDAVAAADHAGFKGTHEFIVGYGMDDSGNDRALPYIAIAD
ncbi:MAG TPA: phosphoribosyltransferase family protein [Rhizomicrobium sp.]|nr:phosphoribosyltransferase family protein [Rhizomicrobium sp.]